MRQRRYNSINELLKKRFGFKIFKVSLESGCGCPNRDSAAGKEGCIFCSEKAYEVATTIVDDDFLDKQLRSFLLKEKRTETISQSENQRQFISQKLSQGIDYVSKRHGAKKFISYFQSGSNTYAPVEKLRSLFFAAIDHPDVIGLAIGTRPDCVTSAHIDLLEELSRKTMLWVELGLQSAHNQTLTLLNRGHTAADFANAVRLLKQKNISVVAHVILGLPGETMKEMLETAKFLNELHVEGVKLHNLHVLKGTVLEKWYHEGRVKLPDLTSYASCVVDFLEHLDPSIVIHRVNGHAPRHLTVAPQWSINKLAIFNAVEKELERRDTWQGKKLKGER